MVDGAESSLLSGEDFINQGRLAWKPLLDEHGGVFYREPEEKRVRALMNNLRLDTRMNGTDHRNYWWDHVQRLKDLD